MHNHDEFSNPTCGLDSINKLKDLIAKSKELGLKGIAITNHDNLCEIININDEQKKIRAANEDFVLAIGNEIYLVDSFDPDDGVRERYYHFILIAKDKIGLDGLLEISSKAWYRSAIKRGRRRIPTLKSDIEEVLAKCKGHIVASSSCIGGELPQHILNERYDAAKAFIDWCQQQFGANDFYIEMQPSRSKEQRLFNKFVYDNYRHLKCIITTDAHYQNKEDFPLFEAFLRSQQENREVKEYYDYARLMDEDEIFELMRENKIPDEFVRECLDNTLVVAEQMQFYDLEQKQIIPNIPIDHIDYLRLGGWEVEYIRENFPILKWALDEENEHTKYCAVTCLNKLKEKELHTNDIYLSRLEEEFDVYKYQSEQLGSNMFQYFVVMQHYLDLAWSIDCAVGPSRGSASGSLTCYLMDIVQCDPIQYNLHHWRFMNKVKTSPADIDVDLQPSKRQELFAAIRAERGELGLTQVATYRTLTLKAAIGNAGRGYRHPNGVDFKNGLDPDITVYLSSLIEVRRGFVATLKQTLEGDPVTGFSKNHQFIKECNEYPGLLEIIIKIEGLIVGSGTHAAAVILFDNHDRLLDHCSLMRAPNGDLCTSLDLHSVERAGCYKYDLLLLSTLDCQATCFKLLQKDNIIPQELSLKECFRKYINPNSIDFDDKRIWDHLYKGDILSVFQWDAQSGRKGILKTHPQTLLEMTGVNGLIRLMTEEGQEDQIERFCRIKSNPESFEEEMINVGLTPEQRKIMHEELDKFNGCAATQESFMILTQRLANYSLKDADRLRKTVAKKHMDEIQEQKEFFYTKCEGTQQQKDYLWRVCIAPSLGYAFSESHSLPYSIIGIQCILLGGILFPPIYWQTACLLQRSGALDNKGIDHNKIAKAVSAILKQGVNIGPVNINHSQQNFEPDANSNTIHFGFSAVKGLKEKVIDEIIAKRPFTSLEDFLERAKSDILSNVTLLKCGAFDEFGDRQELIDKFCDIMADKKSVLNGRNLQMISREGLWPQDTDELKMAQRIVNATIYMKKLPLPSEDLSKKEWYGLDKRMHKFFEDIEYPLSDPDKLSIAEWKEYQSYWLPCIKQYLIEHQEEMLNKVNTKAVQYVHNKYFADNDLGQWEIETMGLTFKRHPFADVPTACFDKLPTNPEPTNFIPIKGGRSVPIYDLTMLSGIVIAKDKLHHIVTLLTSTGPVEVKFRKEQFAVYDAQISQKVNGVKKVIEKSWFSRGTKLLVHGMRQDDLFRAKTYKRSKMKHTVYKITGFDDNGKLTYQMERKKGISEETEE